MSDKKVYLKPNVVFEPLFDNWYAWPHLLSPATAAMNITKRHLSIIDSYLQAPAFHAMAVKAARMRGGPFMDVEEGRIKEIRELRDKTLATQDHMIRLADAIATLDELLRNEGQGFSLEPLYARVPEILKGYVELFYDRNNNASFRFFEGLLYDSLYFDKRSQSLAFWVTNNDSRPFVFSTPRLEAADVLHVNIPFDHPAIDELARMKRTPQNPEDIISLLDIPERQETLFDSFFTTDPPPVYKRYTGDKIRMRYFGHACILIETRDVSILIDPVISYYGYYSDIEHFSFADLPDQIDFVLITHNHPDHVLFETLLPLRHKIGTILVPGSHTGRLEDPDLRLLLNRIGFDRVIGVGEMETVRFSDACITGIPFTGEHSDLNILSKSCYVVEISGFILAFLSDSRLLEPALYRHVQKKIGDLDVVFLGMECDGAPLTWFYGPLITRKLSRDRDESRRLSGSNCAEGLSLVDIFRPKEIYVYAMGQEPWLEFLTSIKYTDESNPIIQSDKLIKECRERGIIAERLFGEKELLYEKKALEYEMVR